MRDLGSLFTDGWWCAPCYLALGFSALMYGAKFFQNGSLQWSLWQLIFQDSSFMSYSHNEPQPSPDFAGYPPRPAVRYDPDSYIVPAFPWDQVYLESCTLQDFSLYFPQSHGAPAHMPLGFKGKCSRGSSFQYQTPRLGNMMQGSELSLLSESLCDIVIFQSVGCPLSWYGIAYRVKVALLPSWCGFFFVFGCRISFFVCVCPFYLFMIVQQLVVSLLFSWDIISLSPSTLSSCPNPMLSFITLGTLQNFLLSWKILLKSQVNVVGDYCMWQVAFPLLLLRF